MDKKFIFIIIGALLAIGSLVLVALGTITYTVFLSSLATIFSTLYGVYEWYTKKEIKVENKILKENVTALQKQKDDYQVQKEV